MYAILCRISIEESDEYDIDEDEVMKSNSDSENVTLYIFLFNIFKKFYLMSMRNVFF